MTQSPDSRLWKQDAPREGEVYVKNGETLGVAAFALTSMCLRIWFTMLMVVEE